MTPQWIDGEPFNLAAAAADADEWMALLQKMVNAGRAHFSKPESAGRLAACRAALAKMLQQEAAASVKHGPCMFPGDCLREPKCAKASQCKRPKWTALVQQKEQL